MRRRQMAPLTGPASLAAITVSTESVAPRRPGGPGGHLRPLFGRNPSAAALHFGAAG